MIDINKEIELSRRVKAGDESAVNELVKANLRFVISVAKQYQNKGLPLVDLIQEGCLGVIEASRRYDESKGFRFISYAVWWIRQAIIHAISNYCRTVRVPMNQIVNINKINKVSSKFEQENERKPSVEELESETNIDSSKINLSITSVNKAISLDNPFKDEENGCLLDVIPNENITSPDQSFLQKNISDEINKVLSNLSNREGDIIKMSFGLGMLPMQNEEIANRFGIVSERVRQIQNEALTKIKERYKDSLRELL